MQMRRRTRTALMLGTQEEREEQDLRKDILQQREQGPRRRNTRVLVQGIMDKTDKLKKFQYRTGREGEGGVKSFNVMKSATDTFGFHHGQRVNVTKGKYADSKATIIGVNSGWLWRQQDGDRGAVAFFARSRNDLEYQYGLTAIHCGTHSKRELELEAEHRRRREMASAEALVVSPGPCHGHDSVDIGYCTRQTAEALCVALNTAWDDKSGDLADELLVNLKSPEAELVALFSELASSAIGRVSAAKATELGLDDYGPVLALVLLLWTQEGLDTDRMLLHEGVPSPRREEGEKKEEE
eukprot:Hpha_TRINITY_DN16354_c3_g3::TRINITY_DN16354_c3_g3_i1::g.60339::m.60339